MHGCNILTHIRFHPPVYVHLAITDGIYVKYSTDEHFDTVYAFDHSGAG